MKKQFVCATKEYSSYEKRIPAPLFRKNFELDFVPSEAVVSICGLGFYELYVNGKNITRSMLAPYICNPDHSCVYDTYDLSPLLHQGKNAIGVILGTGFINPWGGAVWDFDKVAWRASPRFALEFSAAGEGKTLSFLADESFLTHDSKIVFDDYRIGETCDQRLELPGWSLPDFDDSDWSPAIPCDAPKGEMRKNSVEPIVVEREVSPVSITEQEGGGFLYDFGLNSAGVCRLKINAKEGQKITMNHCERLRRGRFSITNLIFNPEKNLFYKDDAYKAIYTAVEGEQEYTPRFVYFGFRYVLVEGITKEQATPELLTYLVMHSDLKQTSGFECSEKDVNTLFKMVQNADLSNFYYFPTDCPHREKNGWTGDASLSAPHTALMYDTEKSYREWLFNIRKAQTEEGMLPGIVPTGGWGYSWGNGPAWDSVLFNLPYTLFKYRACTDVIRENADAMMRYLKYIDTRRSPDGTIAIGLGDWVPVGRAQDDYKSPLVLTDSIMVFDVSKKAAEMLSAIGRNDDAEFASALSSSMLSAIRENLLDVETATLAGNCQTSQAIGLYYGVFKEEERKAAFDRLLEFIHAENDSFDCGFIGLHTIFHVLSEFGEDELAYHMIMKPEYPSYKQMVDLGETAIVENIHPEGSIGSHNHHFLGDIGRWFIFRLAGLTVIDSKHIIFRPSFVKALDFASAYCDLPDGRAEISWKRENGRIALSISCPECIDHKISLPETNEPIDIIQ